MIDEQVTHAVPELRLVKITAMSYSLVMRTIPAAKFKEQCLSLLDKMNPAGVLITKHGKPVAKLIPVQSEDAKLIGKFRGKIKIKGNIMSTGVKWDAES